MDFFLLTNHVDSDRGLNRTRQVGVECLAREVGPVVGPLQVGDPQRVANLVVLGVNLLNHVVEDFLAWKKR